MTGLVLELMSQTRNCHRIKGEPKMLKPQRTFDPKAP
jgi:hypothetical protein